MNIYEVSIILLKYSVSFNTRANRLYRILFISKIITRKKNKNFDFIFSKKINYFCSMSVLSVAKATNRSSYSLNKILLYIQRKKNHLMFFSRVFSNTFRIEPELYSCHKITKMICNCLHSLFKGASYTIYFHFYLVSSH